MKTLAVTSPYTENADVTKAQRRLRGQNYLFANYLLGPVDGVFGELTGRGCIRAKWWQGYPQTRLEPIYGDEIDAYLSGAKPLPAEYAKRRAARVKAAAAKPMRMKALSEALGHLGKKESPAGSNNVEFSRWYGMRGPWCAMFTTYCYVRAGSVGMKRGVRYAYVPYVVQDARAGRNGLAVTTDPKPGDLVCFDWNGNGVADHIGLFEAGDAIGSFSSIEGNTAVGNDSNGGEVMRRTRARGQVQCFVRVGR